MGNKKLTIALTIGVYLAFAFFSYAFFSRFGVGSITPGGKEEIGKAPKETNDYEALVFDSSKPKTEECPLNGAKYSKEQRNWWEGHRPLGIMIENHTEARPQSGLAFADVIYEVVAEGGITRFLAVYYCQDAGIVGPVRSARTYFLDFISEYGPNPLYAHVGGANTPGPANALGQIDDYGWGGYNDLNQFSIGFPTFRRDEGRLGRPVATEHTMYSTTTKLWEVAKKRKLTQVDEDGNEWNEEFDEYTFKDDNPTKNSQTITIPFMGEYDDYIATWKYDPATDSYLRSNGGSTHTDRNTGKQINAKNVVVLFMNESRANDGYEGNLHMLYGTKGKGKALIFQDGKEIVGNWSKSGREGRLIITANGKEVAFNRGLIWFEVLATGTDVDVN